MLAHLNHVFDCEADSPPDMFPLLLSRCTWSFDIQKMYSTSVNVHKYALEAFSLKRLFDVLEQSAIYCSTENSVRLEMAACQTVLNMTYSGISFDHSTCSVFIKTFRNQIETLQEQITRLSHGKVNLDSPAEVSNVLFNRLGLVYPESSSCKGKQRHLPANKIILEQIRDQHAVVGKIIDFRHIQHTVTQCLLPLSEYRKRIHCWFEMCTATGRIMTLVPNLQVDEKQVEKQSRFLFRMFQNAYQKTGCLSGSCLSRRQAKCLSEQTTNNWNYVSWHT